MKKFGAMTFAALVTFTTTALSAGSTKTPSAAAEIEQPANPTSTTDMAPSNHQPEHDDEDVIIMEEDEDTDLNN